jgi:hypothetical protein
MAAQMNLHSIPDNSPLKVLLLRKCLRRMDKLKSFGIEKVRMAFYPSQDILFIIENDEYTLTYRSLCIISG